MYMFQFGKVFVIRISFEKFKLDYNQTWVKDAIGVLLYVNKKNVMYQGQGPSEVKLGGKCKICIFFFFVFVEIQLILYTTKPDL